MVLNWQFSNIPHCRGCFQPASLPLMSSYHTTVYEFCVTSEWIKRLALFISYKSWPKRGARSPALCWRLIPLFETRLADASGSATLRFRMRCHLKTAPNIGEVSLVSAISPLLEYNVPVLPMASRRSRAPQTSGPYALCHPFPSLATPLLACHHILICWDNELVFFVKCEPKSSQLKEPRLKLLQSVCIEFI